MIFTERGGKKKRTATLMISQVFVASEILTGLVNVDLQITAYFMELATPHTEEAIKLVDKVGGIEWLIQKYEVDGASAVKLDLSLDTPIIVVPRNSLSKELVFQLFSFLSVGLWLHFCSLKTNWMIAIHGSLLPFEFLTQ